jgi:hypothetical protein
VHCERDLLRLIGLAYECATAAEHWTVFLATFAALVESVRPLIYLRPDHPAPDGRQPVIASVD